MSVFSKLLIGTVLTANGLSILTTIRVKIVSKSIGNVVFVKGLIQLY